MGGWRAPAAARVAPGGSRDCLDRHARAAGSDLAASADATILVVGEANSGGGGAVQRRDPATGAVLASHPMLGVVAPSVGGLIDSGVWVSQPTGMMGYVERLAVATLAPEPGTRAGGGNGISARVVGGLLWVTGAGAQARSYCADPSDGRLDWAGPYCVVPSMHKSMII